MTRTHQRPPVLDRYGVPIEIYAHVYYVHGSVTDLADLADLPEGKVTAVRHNPDVVAVTWRGKVPPHFSGDPRTLIVA